MKNCDNCYWKDYQGQWCAYSKEEPEEKQCGNHDFMCEDCDADMAMYKYDDKHYCKDCLLVQFGSRLEEVPIIHYYLDGEHIGSDEDMEDVIQNLSSDIETL